MAILSFDGINLSQYLHVRIERSIGPTPRAEVREVSGRHGDVVLGVSREPYEVLAHCRVKPAYMGAWDSTRRVIAAAICKDAECVLTLPDEDGLWRYAVASPSSSIATPLDPETEFDIVFTCHDPIARGETKTATVPSGSSASITIGGTCPTTVHVLATSAVRDASSLVWGIQFDNGNFLHVKTGSSSARRVEIDCEKRSCKLANVASMVTLDSNWPKLAPGTHTVNMNHGTGAATLTWVERWL